MAEHVTAEELDNLSLACQRLWDLDEGRLSPGQEYQIDVQRGRRFGETRDAAREPLFRHVNPEVFQRPTYKAFLLLLDNYTSETGVAEVVTEEERRETWAFLDAVMATKVMQYAHEYVVHKGRGAREETAFKRQLFKMWFSMYRRDTAADSSGFEHVFLGEHDDGEVKGLHNWIFFYQEEQKGLLDYKGFVGPRYRTPGTTVDNNDQMLSVSFSWKGLTKPVSSLFVGTSPEFEFALYSLVFFCGEEYNKVEIDVYNLAIRAYAMRCGAIGTVFPELESEDAV